MNANQILAKLDRAQVDAGLDAEARRVIADEACTLRAAIQTRGDVGAALTEAVRVARMWGVAI